MSDEKPQSYPTDDAFEFIFPDYGHQLEPNIYGSDVVRIHDGNQSWTIEQVNIEELEKLYGHEG
jgi:hypothetical protein